MPTDNAAAWDRYAAAYQARAELPTSTAHYGPDIPTEASLRLLGDLKGKRVLELGCGGAQCSIAFARRLCERDDVKVELRHGDLADLAFLRADSIDVVFSANAFNFVDDLNRVFRQVHRVLKVSAPLVFSVPHPTYRLLNDAQHAHDPVGEPLRIRRSYFDKSPIETERNGIVLTEYHHTMADIYMGLARSSYRVDLVIEPEPVGDGHRSPDWSDACLSVPRTLIVRARKEGN